ncbi:MAG: hypothetical protein HY581_12490 [Nitrospirae bacterium]|nr:hypothetical protein [Nitrospirota bacterium]
MNGENPDSDIQHSAFIVPRSSFIAVRLLCFLSLALIVGQVLGCSSKEPRYPADHARFKRIDDAVESLRKAYVRKDLSGVQALLLPSNTLDQVELEVRKDFDSYHEIALDLAIERIVIDGDTIDVFVHWQGHWKRTGDDTGQRERGHGMLRWVGVQSILLQGVEGDLPFGMASRRMAPTPPKSAMP